MVNNKNKMKLKHLSWGVVLVSGFLSSGAALAFETDGGSFTSSLISLQDISNIPISNMTTIPVSTCAAGTVGRVVISYTSSMESNYTFENISGSEANLATLINHAQLDLSVGSLPPRSPDLNSYSGSWLSTNSPANSVAINETQTDVSPEVPSPTVFSAHNGLTRTYTSNLSQFEIGQPSAIVTLTAAANKTEMTPGTWKSDNVTFAEGFVSVQYYCEIPETELRCNAELGVEGDTVTARLVGDESCSELAITEEISCTGDLAYVQASDPANCSITESPAGTLEMTCTSADVIPRSRSRDKHLIGGIIGEEGSCTTQVTAMSCLTPTGQTLVADTSLCGDDHIEVPPPPPTLTCNAELGAAGDAVTATLSGEESCSELAITETISCTGGVGYAQASDPANCSITESPSGTLEMTCTAADVVPANGSKVNNLIGDITGDGGSCTTQVTAMSCSTPRGETVFADTSACGDEHSVPVIPPPILTCNAELGAEGDTVTAALSGEESCSELTVTETISCTGDLAYAQASDPANCSITENPSGTLEMTCTTADVIPANGNKTNSLIGDITGAEGTCTTQVTAMSCSTPRGATVTADTSACAGNHLVVAVPPPTLTCNAVLGVGGDTVTATLSGEESCSELAITETISCTGDLVYTQASNPANCNISENPAGTLDLSCTAADVISANGSKSSQLIGGISGMAGDCTTQVTAMSCATPRGATVTADTSSCGSDVEVNFPVKPPARPIPTLSEWTLMLLASLMGLIGVKASRRRI